jgi:hypothetical protein
LSVSPKLDRFVCLFRERLAGRKDLDGRDPRPNGSGFFVIDAQCQGLKPALGEFALVCHGGDIAV